MESTDPSESKSHAQLADPYVIEVFVNATVRGAIPAVNEEKNWAMGSVPSDVPACSAIQ